jgi:predicted SAM-dependent methyltransferase
MDSHCHGSRPSRPSSPTVTPLGVHVVIQSVALHLSALADGSVDTVFTSNFFEHLPTKEVLMETLRESHRVLTPVGGSSS